MHSHAVGPRTCRPAPRIARAPTVPPRLCGRPAAPSGPADPARDKIPPRELERRHSRIDKRRGPERPRTAKHIRRAITAIAPDRLRVPMAHAATHLGCSGVAELEHLLSRAQLPAKRAPLVSLWREQLLPERRGAHAAVARERVLLERGLLPRAAAAGLRGGGWSGLERAGAGRSGLERAGAGWSGLERAGAGEAAGAP
eukprot:811512-Prymnesium_polylepis.1